MTTCLPFPGLPEPPCRAVARMMGVQGYGCNGVSHRVAAWQAQQGMAAAAPGDAVMFYQQEGGTDSIRVLHAGCGVDRGSKVVLAKFLRAGPRPYKDEALFQEALDASGVLNKKREL